MLTSVARTAPGSTRQRSGSLSSTTTPCSRRQAIVISTWGSEGSALALVAHVDAALVARTGEQQRRDELARRGGVDGHGSASDRAGPTDREGQRARDPRRRPRRRALGVLRGRRPSAWCARARHRRSSPARRPGPPPVAGTASPSRRDRSRPVHRAGARARRSSRTRRCRPRHPSPPARRPSARCRANAVPVVRPRGRRPALPAPAPGWSATSSRAGRHWPPPDDGPGERATGHASSSREATSAPRGGVSRAALSRSTWPPASPRGAGAWPPCGRRAHRGGRARPTRGGRRCRRRRAAAHPASRGS